MSNIIVEQSLSPQIKQKNNTDLRNIGVFYTESDYNGAFNQNKEVLQSLYDQIKVINAQLPPGEAKFTIRVYEISSVQALARALIRADRAYGDTNPRNDTDSTYTSHKFETAIIGGHGAKGSIDLSSNENLKGGTLRQEQLRGKGAKRALQFFEPHPTFMLFSCSTGELGGIGDEMSTSDVKVHAPKVPTSPKSIDVRISNNELGYEVLYNDEGAEMTYEGGRYSKAYIDSNSQLR